MKNYEPKQLVAISRYQNYFPSLPAEIREDVYARMRELIEEEKAYCDKGNYNDRWMAKSIDDSIDFAAKRQVWQRMIL